MKGSQILILLGMFSAMLILASCKPGKVAPVMKRTIEGFSFDTNYLNEIFSSTLTNQDDQLEFKEAVKELNAELMGFHSFMQQVESGQIKVIQDPKGYWCSSIVRNDYRFHAGYLDELALVNQYDKRKNQNSFTLIYGLSFYPDGHLKGGRSIERGLSFTETGKVKVFWSRNKFDVEVRDDGKILYRSYRPSPKS